MKTLPRVSLLVVLLIVAAVSATPAAAGLDIDFGASVTLGDSDDVFLSVAARYSDQDKEQVRNLAYRYRDPDDLSVALFVMRHSGRSAEWVWDLRRRGFAWWEIAIRAGMGPDVFFVPVRHDPGPPFGKAYGHWKKQKARPETVVLTDDDVRNLVAVRIVHEYYGVPVEAAMEWRATGRDMRSLVVDEYHRRHGGKRHAGSQPRAAHEGPPGHAKGKKKGDR